MNILKGLCFLTLASCAHLTIKDLTLCADAGSSGAVCDRYLTSNQTMLNSSEWDALRFGWLAMSPEDWGNLKVELESACDQLHCAYEQKVRLKSLFKRIRDIQSNAQWKFKYDISRQ